MEVQFRVTSCRSVSLPLSRIRFNRNLRISFLFSAAEIELGFGVSVLKSKTPAQSNTPSTGHLSMGVWPNLSFALRAVWMNSCSLCSRQSSLSTSSLPSLLRAE